MKPVLGDLRWLWFLFESLVVRDLCIYAQSHDAVIRNYRDNTSLEVDAVIDSGDARWAGFEVKLGHAQVEEAAAESLRFRDRVDTDACGASTVLAVVVTSGIGYVRTEGVAVIPIAALGSYATCSTHPLRLPPEEVHQHELPQRHRVREVRLAARDLAHAPHELHQRPITRQHERVDRDATPE